MMTSGFRKIVFSVLLFGVTIVGYQYMIKPANKNLANTKGRLETKLSQLSKFGQAATAAEDLTKQLEELEEAIDRACQLVWIYELSLRLCTKCLMLLPRKTIIILD